MNSYIIQKRCQCGRPVMCPRWSRLGEFVPTVSLLYDSRLGCWPCLCRPPFSGMVVPSFVLPSLEISSSSHHSWRLLLLFKLSPLLWAASFGILSLWSVVDSVVSLIGSWCDKCGIVWELEEGCELLLILCETCEWERLVLGDPSSKSERLRNMLAGSLWEGLWHQDFGCKLTLISLLMQSMMFSYVLYVMYLIAHEFLTLWVNRSLLFRLLALLYFLCIISGWLLIRRRKRKLEQRNGTPSTTGWGRPPTMTV